MGETKYFNQEELKALRVQIDACQQAIAEDKQTHTRKTPEGSGLDLYLLAHMTATTKLIEAKMWVGKMLESLGSELPAEFRDKASK